MRKRTKIKKKSCALCKPHKTGHENRWKPKEEQALKEFERLANQEKVPERQFALNQERADS